MPKHYLIYPLLLVALIVGSSALAEGIEPRKGWQIINTDKSFPALVDSLVASVKAQKMGLVTQASASAGAKAQGYTIPGNRVVGVYRNDYARRMLEASIAAGIEAPIRFYVTENSDGTATLSWKTPSFVFEPYMNEGGEALQQLAQELDTVFQAIADGAVTGTN
ncbi:DUF302 domain-containing protein [Roseibium sp. RKSG952]|uniref:DUF302 domain-containing protein n=1 Tax=Roseibium sp. RKSG952 TaxID=2529384 RepID=UPI0012BB5870|nr:DUF302 domain-containing protein [Roseibium sp. RKSG952]MTI00320.1 DUF302 domain-containing protein [Roseibium sp. RKSG952]